MIQLLAFRSFRHDNYRLPMMHAAKTRQYGRDASGFLVILTREALLLTPQSRGATVGKKLGAQIDERSHLLR